METEDGDQQKAPDWPLIVEMEEYGAWGCKSLKNKGLVLCPSCEREYHEDPDAFK